MYPQARTCIGAFDQPASRKYTDWLSGCTDEFLIGEGVFDDIALIIFDELKKAGIIVQLPEIPITPYGR